MGARRTPGGDVLKAYRVRIGGEDVLVTVEEDAGAYRVTAAGSVHQVDLVALVPGWYSLVVDGRSHDLGVRGRSGRRTLVLDGETYIAEIGGSLHAGGESQGRRARARRSREVRAPMPGLVVALQIVEGAEVAMGEPLIIMEAMKMQMEIRAPHPGKVGRVHVASGLEVAEGQVLVTLE